MAKAYGISRTTLIAWLKRSHITISTAKVFSPKEFNAIVEAFDEPDWAPIEKYLKSIGH